MSTENSEFDREMKDSFLAEAADLLDQVQSLLLTVERDPEATEAWDALFRLAHNLKGSGMAVGFEDFASFAHEVENLLIAVRRKELPASKETIDLLLESVDIFRCDIEALRRDHRAVLDHRATVERIVSALKVGSSTPTSSAPETVRAKRESGGAAGAASSSEDSIRIGLKKIDDLMNNLGEQIILQSALDQARYDYEGKKEEIVRAIQQLNKLTYDIQQTAMSLRMVSLRQTFSKLERAVRDTASLLGKEIRFHAEGHEQELDKTILDTLADALVHMVRNSADHGIEPNEERRAAGKPSIGTIQVRAYRRGGFFYIEIIDDGKGLDREKIYARGVKAGIVREGQELPDAEVYELIFENGFSTKDQVSETSGRGVGMDVVKQSILQVKGGYQIQTQAGKGTTFTIRLPLTLAVFNGMVIRVGSESYILPNSDVEEVIKVRPEMIRQVSDSEQMVQIRDRAFPLIFLKDEISMGGVRQERRKNLTDGVLIVSRINRVPYVFLVDELVSQQRVVYKALGKEAQSIRGAVGATILGDGSVALILEFSRLVRPSEAAA